MVATLAVVGGAGRRVPGRRGGGRRRRLPHRGPAPPPGQRASRRRRAGPARRGALGHRTAVARPARRRAAGRPGRGRPCVSDLVTDAVDGARDDPPQRRSVTVKADPDAQRRLLDLQAIDTAAGPDRAPARRRCRSSPSWTGWPASSPRWRTSGCGPRSASTTSTATSPGWRRTSNRSGPGPTATGPGSTPAPDRPRSSRRCSTSWAPSSRRQGELEDAELELMEQRETEPGRRWTGSTATLEPAPGTARAETEARRDTALVRSRQGARRGGPVPRAAAGRRSAGRPGRRSTRRSASRPAWAPRCCGPAGARAAGWSCPVRSGRGYGRPRRTRSSGARSAGGSWSAPRSPACRRRPRARASQLARSLPMARSLPLARRE